MEIKRAIQLFPAIVAVTVFVVIMFNSVLFLGSWVQFNSFTLLYSANVVVNDLGSIMQVPAWQLPAVVWYAILIAIVGFHVKVINTVTVTAVSIALYFGLTRLMRRFQYSKVVTDHHIWLVMSGIAGVLFVLVFGLPDMAALQKQTTQGQLYLASLLAAVVITILRVMHHKRWRELRIVGVVVLVWVYWVMPHTVTNINKLHTNEMRAKAVSNVVEYINARATDTDSLYTTQPVFSALTAMPLADQQLPEYYRSQTTSEALELIQTTQPLFLVQDPQTEIILQGSEEAIQYVNDDYDRVGKFSGIELYQRTTQ